MRALRTHRVLSRRVFRYYYHCLRPLAYAKGGSGRLTVMAGFNDGWLEDTTLTPEREEATGAAEAPPKSAAEQPHFQRSGL